MSITPETGKHVLDVAAVGMSAVTIIELLPVLLAVPTAIWMCIRTGEWVHKKWTKRNP